MNQRSLSYNLQTGFIKDIPLNSERNFGLGLGIGYAVNSYYTNLIAEESTNGITYEIRDTDLLVRSGPFRWKINLEDIRSIQPSHSLISSPALSLDRLEIRYGSGQVILISPKDHAAFIDQLATSTEFI